VANGVARIAAGLEDELVLGDLDARRDWGYAGDYVRAMRLMLRQATPTDFVIATGEMHSVRELVEVAFAHVGLDWRDYVRTDPILVRGRAELHNLVGAPTKARALLGWQPSVSFEELVRLLVDADLQALARAVDDR
jgi:GDPmannose 4,6-dehydratase